MLALNDLRLSSLSGGFSLASFMASQSAGFWYNFLRNDTMFQEDVGPTPADEPNEVIGLALSQRLWGGQTRTAYLAGQPENRQNGAPVVDGTATAATYDPSTGAGTVTRVDFNNQSGVAISGLTGARVYAIDIDAPANMNIRDGVAATGAAIAATIAGRNTYYVMIGAAAAGLTMTATAAGGTQSFTLHSVRLASQVPATQSTTSFKPKRQTTGAAFDGTDDNLLTNYTAGSGANFLIAKVVVPASLSGTQIVAGALAATHFYLAFTAAGYARGGAGGVTLTDTQDLRGTEVLVGFSNDGTTMRLFVGGGMVAEAPQVSGVPAAVPFRLGALNSSGTATNFFGSSIQHVLAGREFIDLARFIQIANALGA